MCYFAVTNKRTMKNLIFLFSLVALIASCGGNKENKAVAADAPKNQSEVVHSQAHTYNVDTEKSQVLWTGDKKIGNDAHTGTISLKDGRLATDNGLVIAGEFTMDMNSIVSTDLDANSGKAKLEGHLKNADFFDVEKFPTAVFTITQTQPVDGNENVNMSITGNLKLKDVEKSITIPANVIVTEDHVSVVSPMFEINRTDWGVKYGSGLAGAVGDRIINDNIKLVINLRANKG